MRIERKVWLRLAVLCLLAGSAWLFDESMPGMLTGLARTATHEALLALVFGLASLRARPLARLQWKIVAGAGAMFAVPQVLMASAGGHVSGMSEVLIFLLAPVAVVFVVAQRSTGFGMDESPLRMMVPALAGLGGGYLIVPFYGPESAAGRVWFAVLVASALLAGATAVWMHEWLAGVSCLRAVALAAAASAVVSGSFYRLDWGGPPVWNWSGVRVEILRCAVLDGPILVLTIWLLREMEPVRFSGRALMIPLVTILESYVLMRPVATWTTWVGIGLMAAGGWGLVRGDKAFGE